MLQNIMMMVEMMKARAALQQQVGTLKMVQFVDENEDGNAEYINIEGDRHGVRIAFENYGNGDTETENLYNCIKDIGQYYVQCKYAFNETEVHYGDTMIWFRIYDDALFIINN